MPEMNGCELARRVTGTRPGIRLLYRSGYAPNAIVQHGVLHGSLSYLQKPFTPANLAQKVREILDKPTTDAKQAYSM
jgi:CheY-like chemotaxis protein